MRNYSRWVFTNRIIFSSNDRNVEYKSSRIIIFNLFYCAQFDLLYENESFFSIIKKPVAFPPLLNIYLISYGELKKK